MLSLAVGVAAGLGAVARLLLDRAVTARAPGRFPFGTLAVNVSGSFVLGLVTGWAAHHGLSARAALVLGAGFAGGFTTLSTLAWETIWLAEDFRPMAAACYAGGSALAGLLAAAAGLGLALL
ncbi:MAG: fluoride exporter [Frankiaceae bacterium]|nr:fluoride exporter [Frankiaceae bacterium]